MITFDEFLAVDVRVGRIIDVQPFPAARKPAYQLEVDFGPEIGRRLALALDMKLDGEIEGGREAELRAALLGVTDSRGGP